MGTRCSRPTLFRLYVPIHRPETSSPLSRLRRCLLWSVFLTLDAASTNRASSSGSSLQSLSSPDGAGSVARLRCDRKSDSELAMEPKLRNGLVAPSIFQETISVIPTPKKDKTRKIRLCYNILLRESVRLKLKQSFVGFKKHISQNCNCSNH